MEHEYRVKSVRLVHPLTGSFIGEYFPIEKLLVVTRHKKTSVINLAEIDACWSNRTNEQKKTTSND